MTDTSQMHRSIDEALDVTVVTPTFNRASLVTRALDSVRVQRRLPKRIVLIDDGSTDGTPDVAREWARAYDFPVTVEVLSKNGGPAAARNRGIELSTTEYVAFLDSDDEYLPGSLDRLTAPLDLFPDVALSFADATVLTASTREPHAVFRTRVQIDTMAKPIGHDGLEAFELLDPIDALLKASIIPTSGTCFRRAAAIAAGGMPADFRSGEDWLFWLKLARHGRFVFTLDDLAVHHRHDDNLTHERSAEFVAREKLRGYLFLRRGDAGIPLTTEQIRRLDVLLDQQVRRWRYHLSLLGLREYWRGLRSNIAREAGSPLAQLLRDPRSALRALLKSATRNA